MEFSGAGRLTGRVYGAGFTITITMTLPLCPWVHSGVKATFMPALRNGESPIPKSLIALSTKGDERVKRTDTEREASTRCARMTGQNS